MKKFFIKNINNLLIIILGVIITWPLNKLFDFISSQINFDSFFSSLSLIFSYKINISLQYILLFLIVLVVVIKLLQLYKNKKLKKRGLIVLSAKYGAKNKYIDIRNELNNSIIKNKLNIVLSNNIAGDPFFGEEKKCEIRYLNKGKEMVKEYNESEIIELP